MCIIYYWWHFKYIDLIRDSVVLKEKLSPAAFLHWYDPMALPQLAYAS